MGFRQKVQHYIWEELNFSFGYMRRYSSKPDWDKLRPMILERINNRAKDYPYKGMIPVANGVLEARQFLMQGVSILLKQIPVKACEHCPEVYVGDCGHRIKSCSGFKHIIKDQEHRWAQGTLSDILSPVEAFHLQSMSQSTIKHEKRFDLNRVPAVLELCYQAGANISEELLFQMSSTVSNQLKALGTEPDGFGGELYEVGERTLNAWDRLRSGVRKLLFVYSAKVCEHCSEVHIGPSGHKARMCGVFKHEAWRGAHKWKKAGVDDLVPQKIVWHRRPHDPPVLVESGQGYYGHAPAVVELCLQAGARIPKKYNCMMKVLGLPPAVNPVELSRRFQVLNKAIRFR